MNSEVSVIVAPIIALVANVRLFPRVLQPMATKVLAPSAAKIASIARKLLARVRPLMVAEMRARNTTIITLVASKRFFARVPAPYMDEEIALVGTPIVALVASKRLVLRGRGGLACEPRLGDAAERGAATAPAATSWLVVFCFGFRIVFCYVLGGIFICLVRFGIVMLSRFPL